MCGVYRAQNHPATIQNRRFAQSPTDALINLKIGCRLCRPIAVGYPVWLDMHRFIDLHITTVIPQRWPAGIRAQVGQFHLVAWDTMNLRHGIQKIGHVGTQDLADRPVTQVLNLVDAATPKGDDGQCASPREIPASMPMSAPPRSANMTGVSATITRSAFRRALPSAHPCPGRMVG